MLVFPTVLVMLYSCSQKDGLGTGGNDDRLEIRISASTTTVTKADDSFSDWDKIGLSVVKWLDGQEQDLTLMRHEDNVGYEYSSENGFVPSSAPAYFPDHTSKSTFYAYYPYNDEGFLKGTNTLNVEAKADQSYYSDYYGSDYMVSVKRDVLPVAEPVSLTFNHIMSKVVVNLIAGQNCTVDELREIKITAKSLFRKGVYDVELDEFTGISAKGDILMFDNVTEGEGRIDGYSAIVVPQTFRSGESLLYLSIYDKTLAFKPQQEIIFAPGSENVFNITVDILNMGPSVSVSTEIRDWQDGGKITGDADEEQPFVGTVSDYEGNVYPYIELGDLYWTAKNLVSTKLNDGTPIDFVEGGNDEWNSLTSAAYCYFENNPDNIQTRGILYNYYVVETGKLCPQGWRLPTKDEYSSLIEEVDGTGTIDPATLISPSWEGMDGTNETGFSAMPCGLALSHWYMDECYLWSSTVDETAVDEMKYGYLYLANYPWTGLNFAYAGMGVRCVKEK